MMVDDAVRVARTHGLDAVQVLARVAGDTGLAPGVQVRAAVELLRFGFGAMLSLRPGGAGGVSSMSDAELDDMIRVADAAERVRG